MSVADRRVGTTEIQTTGEEVTLGNRLAGAQDKIGERRTRNQTSAKATATETNDKSADDTSTGLLATMNNMQARLSSPGRLSSGKSQTHRQN